MKKVKKKFLDYWNMEVSELYPSVLGIHHCGSVKDASHLKNYCSSSSISSPILLPLQGPT